MRFYPPSIDRAKDVAKDLKKALKTAHGITATLTQCQGAVAAMYGYKSFAELSAVTAKGGHTPGFDESLTGPEAQARRYAQERAIVKIFDLATVPASDLLADLRPTAASRISESFAYRITAATAAGRVNIPDAEYPDFGPALRAVLAGARAINKPKKNLPAAQSAREDLGIEVLDARTVRCNLTAEQWFLEGPAEDCAAAARTLNKTVEDAVRNGRSIVKSLYAAGLRLAHVGAAENQFHRRVFNVDIVITDSRGSAQDEMFDCENALTSDLTEAMWKFPAWKEAIDSAWAKKMPEAERAQFSSP